MKPDLSAGIDVMVRGSAGPTGKTTVQAIIAKALLRAGYEVICYDSCTYVRNHRPYRSRDIRILDGLPLPSLILEPQAVRISTRIRITKKGKAAANGK